MLFNLRTSEAEADGSLWVGLEASMVDTVSSKTARTMLTLSQKNKTKNHLTGQMAQQVKTTIAQDLGSTWWKDRTCYPLTTIARPLHTAHCSTQSK